jgi:hypothetical protein
LSVRLKLPVLGPEVVGVKVTAIVQLAWGTIAPPHALVCEKSPWMAMPVIERLAEPEFVTVIVCGGLEVPTAWDPKLTDVGARLTAGAIPVPEKDACCEPPTALSVMVSDPLRAPTAVGVNVMFNWQFAPGWSVVGQLLV